MSIVNTIIICYTKKRMFIRNALYITIQGTCMSLINAILHIIKLSKVCLMREFERFHVFVPCMFLKRPRVFVFWVNGVV